MLVRILCASREDIPDTSNLVASPAAILFIRMLGCARARRGVTRVRVGWVEIVGARTRIYVMKPSPKIDAVLQIDLVEVGYEPRPRPIVGVEVVVVNGELKCCVALGPVLTAGRAASVLDGEHRHAQLDAIAKLPPCAICRQAQARPT